MAPRRSERLRECMAKRMFEQGVIAAPPHIPQPYYRPNVHSYRHIHNRQDRIRAPYLDRPVYKSKYFDCSALEHHRSLEVGRWVKNLKVRIIAVGCEVDGVKGMDLTDVDWLHYCVDEIRFYPEWHIMKPEFVETAIHDRLWGLDQGEIKPYGIIKEVEVEEIVDEESP
jgi:hypothetical protein